MEKKDSDNMEHRKKERKTIEDQKQDYWKLLSHHLAFSHLLKFTRTLVPKINC